MAPTREFTLDQLVTDPDSEPVSGRYIITPVVAREILDNHNRANRRLRAYRVLNYANDMQAGTWKYNGVPLMFDWDGEMFDGQHRLYACIEAGVPFDTQIVHNLEPETKRTVDDGIPRSMADRLAWEGHTETSVLAAATSAWYRWLGGAPDAPRGKRPTVVVALAIIEANPGLVAATKERHKVRMLGIPAGAWTPFIHAIRMVDPDGSEVFIESLTSGANLSPTSPIYVARRWFENRRLVSNAKIHVDPSVHVAILIKAWNWWLAGKNVSTIGFRHTGPARERFPRLMTPAGVAWTPVNERPEVYIPQAIDLKATLTTVTSKGRFTDADEPVSVETMQAMADALEADQPADDHDGLDALRRALGQVEEVSR